MSPFSFIFVFLLGYMEKGKNKTIMTLYIKDGIISERNPFENSMKWDSPAVVRALRRKLNGKDEKK